MCLFTHVLYISYTPLYTPWRGSCHCFLPLHPSAWNTGVPPKYVHNGGDRRPKVTCNPGRGGKRRQNVHVPLENCKWSYLVVFKRNWKKVAEVTYCMGVSGVLLERRRRRASRPQSPSKESEFYSQCSEILWQVWAWPGCLKVILDATQRAMEGARLDTKFLRCPGERSHCWWRRQ